MLYVALLHLLAFLFFARGCKRAHRSAALIAVIFENMKY